MIYEIIKHANVRGQCRFKSIQIKQKDLIHITICGRMGSTDGGHFYTITIRHIAIGF